MPHINIKFFPIEFTIKQKIDLTKELTQVIQHSFNCDENYISIALEPIEAAHWHEQVYCPEVEQRKHLLCKVPNYSSALPQEQES